MSIQMMHEVTRISDRFIGRESLESIDRQGRLVSVVAMVFIFHLVTGIALLKMDEFSNKRSRFIPSMDIAFEANVLLKALPAPIVTAASLPTPLALTKGLTNPGGMIADKLAAEKLTVPIPAAAHQTDVIVSPRPAAASEQIRKTDVRPETTSKEPTPDSTVATARTQNGGNQFGANVARNESGAQAKSGTSEGSELGKEDGRTGHTGVGGTGSVSGSEGAGDEEGLAGGVLPAVATLPATPVLQKRDIAPYRNNLVALLAKNWKVPGRVNGLTVYLLLSGDGNVVDSRIVRSSGKESVDRSVLEAVQSTQFEPLPDWYKGETLAFQIAMQKR